MHVWAAQIPSWACEDTSAFSGVCAFLNIPEAEVETPQLGSTSRGSQGKEKLGKIFNKFKQKGKVTVLDSKEI